VIGLDHVQCHSHTLDRLPGCDFFIQEPDISPHPNLRHFVSESLRPVVENRWFHKTPNYALEIIEHLFLETAPFPPTSVGNNLSGRMRVDQETT
jgi:hypothetical protein